MKKTLLFIAAGAALFAAGCWVGSAWNGAAHAAAKPGPLVSATAAVRPEQSRNAMQSAAAAGAKIHPFTAGRPFLKGTAKEWLLALSKDAYAAAGSGGINRLIDAVQQLMTMDEDCAAEVLAALNDHSVKEIDGQLGQLGAILAASRLSQLNPAALLSMLKDPQAGIDGQAVQIVFSRMVMQNEAQAATMIESIDPKYRRTALDVVLQNLAGKDPLAALALVEKYPGDAPENRQNEIISSLMKKDPQQGIAAAVKLTEMGKGTGFLRQGMNEWAAADKSAAEAWAAAYTGTGQTTARAWLLERKAAADPLGSLTEFNTLQQSVGNPQELSSTAAAIAHHLVRKDLPAAREWATGLPPGPVRDEVMSRVVDQWVQRDPGAASAWISALPEGKERDNSATRLAHQITHSDPPGAFEWARTIQNQEQRTNTLKDIVDEWLRQDSDAAKAAVETLPAEMRKGLPGFK